jgi:hypothetical protein
MTAILDARTGLPADISTTTNPLDGGKIVGSTCVTDPNTGVKGFVTAPGAQLVALDGGARASYRAGHSFLLAANPTDVFVLQGSASKTVRIRRIVLSGFAAVTPGQFLWSFLKRSSANTGGTTSARAALPCDPNDAAASALATAYTANPSALGTLVGTAGMRRMFFALLTRQNDRLVFEPRLDGKAYVLRGSSQFFCVNGAGAALPDPNTTLDIEIEWDEDLS